MVIQFCSIARHLQIKIVEKLSYEDSREFDLSSKHGRTVANLVSNQVPIDIWSVKLTTSVELSIGGPQYSHSYTWKLNEILNAIKGKERKPKFSVSHIYFYRLNALLEFLQAVETGLFVFHNTYLAWYFEDKIDRAMFVNMLETFKVRSFYLASPRFDSELVGTQQFCELENVNFSYPMKVSGNAFFHFKVHTIKFVGLNSDVPIGSILNQMFQQWHQSKREIRRIEIQLNREYESMEPKTLFANIPHTVIWSNKTPNSLLDYVPFITGNTHKKNEVFLLQTGTKKLMVMLEPDRFVAILTSDETKELEKLLR